MVTPKDLIRQLDTLDERTVCELYPVVLQRAMEMNPLREWRIVLNPTQKDLIDALQTLSPADCQKLEDQYF